jgi:hypothetical protein
MRLGISSSIIAIVSVLSPVFTHAAAIELSLAPNLKPTSALATATALKLDIKGDIAGQSIRFGNLLPDTKYDLSLTLPDGSVLRGVDMAWYLPEKPGAKFDPLDDDDRAEIKELFDAVQGFENKRNLLLVQGNHDHATVLGEMIRDTEFHSSAGGEIIWRIELWYYKNQHGGWEKVAQQNQVLYRERFKTTAAYDAFVKKFRWRPDLGGLTVGKDQTVKIEVK